MGDITHIKPQEIPNFDILCAGFPCQPFSQAGFKKGFNETRGTLFFDIVNIIQEKQPKAFFLENVRGLLNHDNGKTFETIKRILEEELGYSFFYKIVKASDFGLPQKRERIIIVGHKEPILFNFPSPVRPFKPLTEILERKVDAKYYASEMILEKRKNKHKSAYNLSIWHENKSGNICSYPYSCALRSGASHNYLLVNGERRLTPREMFRLQGFPDNYKIVVSDGQAKRQAGNAVPVNLVKAVILKLLPYVSNSMDKTMVLRDYEVSYGE